MANVSPFQPKQMNKTRKSVSKRFKVTGSGKVIYRSAGKRHNLRNKSVKQRRK
jgi:large subunit ribosomal protein L35